MSIFFSSGNGSVVQRHPGTPAASTEPPVLLLANGILEELYRRRAAVGFAAAMAFCLMAAAVGLRVWSIGPAPSETPDSHRATVSSSSEGSALTGPSGTWQRWADLGSEKLSAGPSAIPAGSPTTTLAGSAERTGATTTTAPPIEPTSTDSSS